MEAVPFAETKGAVVIQRVMADSPAAEAGLTADDTITAVDGETVTNPRAVVEIVESHQPGDTLTLTIKKAGQDDKTSVEVTLGEDPNRDGKAYLGIALGYMIHFVGETGEAVTLFEVAPEFQWQPNDEFKLKPDHWKLEPPTNFFQIDPVPGTDFVISMADGTL
jgi:hypothetical protein